MGNTNHSGKQDTLEGKENKRLAALSRKPSLTRVERTTAAVKAHIQKDLPNCNCYVHKARGNGTKGICPICLRENVTLCQDHDHTTNKLRDMICMRCNMVLGSVHDNTYLLRNMAVYLESHNGNSLNINDFIMQVAESNGYDPNKALAIAERVASSMK